MTTNGKGCIANETAERLARFAMEALLEEVRLTPKPGLVDRENNGVHHDLDLPLMELSASVLRCTFFKMAIAAAGKRPSQPLREQLAAIGRYGEQMMLQATGGVNTHKGAIWILGLLAAASGILLSQQEPGVLSRNDFLLTSGEIAAFEDRYARAQPTNGSLVRKKYMVRSAREEATGCFPSLREAALPAWDKYCLERTDIRSLNVLLALMSVVDDTCILHRSNAAVLTEVKRRARSILRNGGMGLYANWPLYGFLDEYITVNGVSPGGSADLLAATLFLQKVMHHYKIQ